MDSFKDYLIEKEEREEQEAELLNEDAAQVAAAVIGLPSLGFLAAYGGAHLLVAASRGIKDLMKAWKLAILSRR
jgi:hypothetical protein